MGGTHGTKRAERRRSNKILLLFQAFPRLVDRFFNWYGGFIADHAIWFIAIPLLVTFVLAPGITQLRRLTDDLKIWPLDSSFTINDLPGHNRFNTYPSVCTCVRCDEYGENCNRTTRDCGDETPKACKGAAEAVDLTCPHLQLMFVSKNRSMTDPDMIADLMEIDLQLTFAKYTLQKFKPAFFLSNVSDWTLCKKREDGSCIQFSVLTGVRGFLSKLPGLQDYDAQTKFILEMVSDPEKQSELKGMIKGQAEKPTYYPFDSPQSNAMFTGPIYGAVTMERQNETWANGVKAGKVKHIGAMQFLYCLRDDDDTAIQDTNLNWVHEMTEWLEVRYTNNKSHKSFYLMVGSTWSRMDRNGAEILRLIPFLIICVICLMFFCGVASIRNFPAHRSLPWIGVIGVGCSILGVGSSFGLCGWIQMEVVDLCFAIPVLVLAVGIDDIFVYTEGWRETRVEWGVRRRLAVTMRTVAPGIVVTSFMNSLAFIIDSQTPMAALQIFSNVGVVAALFDFVFQMTLFPGCFALLAKAEQKNRNACCCCCGVKARTNSNYRKKNFCYLICCTAPKSTILKAEDLAVEDEKADQGEKERQKDKKEQDKDKEMEMGDAKKNKQRKPQEDSRDPASIHSKPKESEKSQHFFRDVYTPLLLKPAISASVIILYIGYAALIGYLCTQLHVGMRLENIVPTKKNGEPNEIQIYLKYFRNFSYTIDVMFSEPDQPYWETETQRDINALYDDLIKMPRIGPDIIGRNWLRDFIAYAQERNMNISTQESFIYHLREGFFKEAKARQDMLFDVKFEDRLMPDFEELDYYDWKLPRIASSRIMVYGVNIVDLALSCDVVRSLHDVSRKHSNINASYFSREFLDVEPMLATSWIIVYNTLCQLLSIILITALMMPHPVALFWISIMLSSITVGVIAITSAWGIDFDQIAMVNIMLTMGYCVDFSAHMTRTYVSSKGKTRLEKTQEALGEFGSAVVQSSVAALLAVLCLGGSYAYILRSGYQFFVVGIFLSDIHTLVFFPVFLLHLGPAPKKQDVEIGNKKKNNKNKSIHHHDAENGSKIDTREITKEVERSMKREKLASIDNKWKFNSHTWSMSNSGASIISGPVRRAYVPDLAQIPPLAEIIETIVVDGPGHKGKIMKTLERKTFILTKMTDLTLPHDDRETTSSNKTSSPDSYEKPPRF